MSVTSLATQFDDRIAKARSDAETFTERFPEESAPPVVDLEKKMFVSDVVKRRIGMVVAEFDDIDLTDEQIAILGFTVAQDLVGNGLIRD